MGPDSYWTVWMENQTLGYFSVSTRPWADELPRYFSYGQRYLKFRVWIWTVRSVSARILEQAVSRIGWIETQTLSYYSGSDSDVQNELRRCFSYTFRTSNLEFDPGRPICISMNFKANHTFHLGFYWIGRSGSKLKLWVTLVYGVIHEQMSFPVARYFSNDSFTPGSNLSKKREKAFHFLLCHCHTNRLHVHFSQVL